MTDQAPKTATRSALRSGLLAFGLLVGVFGSWAGLTRINGAVIAPGSATVPGKPQEIQHLDGGIIADIAVAEGDQVAPGDVLVRLDPTVLELGHGVARTRLADALALKSRLEAEIAGDSTLTFAVPDLPFAAPDMAAARASQSQIFEARLALRASEENRLTQTLAQYKSQIEGLNGQLDALDDQIAVADDALATTATLVERNLSRSSALSQQQQARSQLAGQRAGLQAELARLITAQRDAELAALQEEQTRHETLVSELRTVSGQIEELTLDIVTRTAQLERIALRAPVGGVVHEMQVATLGGVISPGATVLQIIPQNRDLDFEVRVDPRSIDQVFPGQIAQVMLSSYDPQSTPRLNGTVTSMSPTAITDPVTGQDYYRISLDIPSEELARLDGVAVIPGMPVEAFLQTRDRSVLSYLVGPLTNQLARAFREEV